MIEIFKSDAHLWFARHDDFDTFKLKRISLEWLTEIELIRLNRCYDERHRTQYIFCLLYTSPSPRDRTRSRMPSSA